MLKHLEITNFIVIGKIDLEFGAGLNILTGETGSGKSIIINALGLLLGNRSLGGQVRTGERVAAIEGLFQIGTTPKEAIGAILQETGIILHAGSELVIRREVGSAGRSRIFVGDEMVNVGTLQLLQPYLMDIFGQGDQRTLMSKQFQLNLLDNFGCHTESKAHVRESFRRWKEAASTLEFHRRESIEAKRMEDYLQYQLLEIKNVNPHIGEDDELLAEKKLLIHAEKISQLGSSAYDQLYESDDSALSKLAAIRRYIEELMEFDASLASALENLQSNINGLSDLADMLRPYCRGAVASPGRLAEVEHRLSELERLKRKYNKDIGGILQVLDEVSGKLSRVANADESEAELTAYADRVRNEYLAAACSLSEKRSRIATEFAKRVTENLSQVALDQANFIVPIKTVALEDSAQFTADGIDQVEFLLAANPGELPKPLAKIASGGELSRLMLVLRTIGTGHLEMAEQNETLVFDEVDVGIGGSAAEAVGKRLKALSYDRQVLCVTHQPQLARFADHHYVVAKTVENGRTLACVRRLDEDSRVRELARMIGGSKVETATLDAAEWLLKHSAELANPAAPSTQKRKHSVKRK